MKIKIVQVLIMLICLFILTFTLKAQSVEKDKDGNYIPSKTKSTISDSIPTGKFYTDKDNKKYLVYATNRLYIIKYSKKTNKYYRSYLRIKQ